MRTSGYKTRHYYPIEIQDSLKASNIADDLWNQLYPSFRGDFKHRLMLIIWGQ
jgi:hypothetical protein